MSKVLYFEGAGMTYEENDFSDIGNYRIRTAFTNNSGAEYYLEATNVPRRSEIYKNVVVSDWGLHIIHLIRVVKEVNGREILRESRDVVHLDYSKNAITQFINNNLGCDFSTIQVLDQFYGYHVHVEHPGVESRYNLIDDHVVNHEQAEKRAAAYKQLDLEYRVALHEKHSVITLREMDDQSITIHCHATAQAIARANVPRLKRIEIL